MTAHGIGYFRNVYLAETRSRTVSRPAASGRARMGLSPAARPLIAPGRPHTESVRSARHRRRRIHVQRLRQEAPAIRDFLDLLAGRLAGTVTRLRVDADDDGIAARLGRLRRRRELEAVRGDDTV